jgi:uncharacterized membrane protein
MAWLFILALAAVAVWQSVHLRALGRRVADLERRLDEALRAAPAPAAAPGAPAATSAPGAEDAEPLLLDRPLPADAREPLVLDQPLAEDELLLDTPLPAPSNDDEPPRPSVAEPARVAAALPSPPRASSDFRLDQWLAERGLAWLAGGALALGLIFLVSFAAQQRWFTPQVQLACALGLGALLLATSEWARRASLRRPPGHPLAAALLAGGGVVALYATTWAAHGLYGFIGYGAAAALLALCALILVGHSFLHGQALGVLAIIAALLAPSLAHAPLWSSGVLTLYVGAVAGAGFLLAAFRRWGWAALATIAGLYFWFAAAIAMDDMRRALALASLAALGGVSLAFRKPLPNETAEPLTWSQTHAHAPAITIVVSSVLLFWVWIAASQLPAGAVAAPAWVGSMFVALAAAAVRARVAAPAAIAVAIGMLVFGFATYQAARIGPTSTDFYPFILFASFVVAISALLARPPRDGVALTAGAGAIGAALLTMLAAFSARDWRGPEAWAALFAGAVVLFTAALYVAREGAASRTQRAVDFWAGAGAALVLLGVESAFPAEARSAAYAGAALLFACGFAWRGWRVLRLATLAAAALAIAQALGPSLVGAALTGAIPLWGALVIIAVAASLLFAAAYFATAEPRSNHGEALSAAGVIVILIGVFLTLRWFAAGGAASLDAFSESALRVIALMAAGHVVMARAGQDVGQIGRWRGHVLMGLGLLYALLAPTLAINPWWGASPATIAGPPLLDSLTLAFAAPAALSLAAARRLYASERTAGRVYAIAGGALALLWAVLAMRRAAQGDQLWGAPVGLLEGACYALLFLASALAIAMIARGRLAKHPEAPFTQDLGHAVRVSAWGALIAAALILLIARHPWWGGHDGAGALQTGLAVLAQLAAASFALALGRAMPPSPRAEPTRFAAAVAGLLFAWSFGHAAIRWLYHLPSMESGAPLIALEGLVHAVWPLVFVLAGAELASRAPGRGAVRAYLGDLQSLWGAAAWPALAFAVIGLWLIFNPWWGANPAAVATPLSAAAAIASLLLAAWLSALAPRVPHLRWQDWFARAATFACIVHLLVAATLAVRWLYHGAAMNAGVTVDLELWVYSAVWALFGAGLFALGLQRNNALLRWSGLALLLFTTLYVYFLIFTRLTGVIRALTAIGLAAVLFVVTWLARTYRPGPEAGDLANVTPAARRERRYGRRQRS